MSENQDLNQQGGDVAADENGQRPHPTNPELVAISDLHQFVGALTDWHTRKVNTLRHMQQIPEGSEVSVNEGPVKRMEGDLLEGFKMGIDVALAELGQLPFVAEMEPTPKNG